MSTTSGVSKASRPQSKLTIYLLHALLALGPFVPTANTQNANSQAQTTPSSSVSVPTNPSLPPSNPPFTPNDGYIPPRIAQGLNPDPNETTDVIQDAWYEPMSDRVTPAASEINKTAMEIDLVLTCLYIKFNVTENRGKMEHDSLVEYTNKLCCKYNIERACVTATRPRVSVYKTDKLNAEEVLLNGLGIPLFRQNIYSIRSMHLRETLNDILVIRVHNPGPQNKTIGSAPNPKNNPGQNGGVRRLVFHTSLRCLVEDGEYSSGAMLLTEITRAMMELHAVMSGRGDSPVIIDTYVVPHMLVETILTAAAHFDANFTTQTPDPASAAAKTLNNGSPLLGNYTHRPYTNGTAMPKLPGPGFWVHKPDMLFTRTEEIPLMAHTGVIADLTPYIENHTLETGEIITKDFGEPYARDFMYQPMGSSRGSYFAFPIMGTSMGMIYNKTTLQEMGYKLIPGSRETFTSGYHLDPSEWTWEKLVEMAIEISIKYGQPSFLFDPGMDEEASLVQLLAHHAHVPLFAPANTTTNKIICGAANPKLISTMEEILGKLHKSGAWDLSVLSPDQDLFGPQSMQKQNISDFGSFLQSFPNAPFPPARPVFQDANFNLAGPVNSGEKQVHGFVLMKGFGNIPLSWFGGKGGMGFGMIPGGINVFSGLGVAVRPHVRNQSDVWNAIMTLNQGRDADDYASMLAFFYGWAPLRQDMWATSRWQPVNTVNSTGGYDYMQVQALKHSLPLGYPVNLPQASLNRLNQNRPFRTMLVEMLYLNQTLSSSARNACDVINLDYVPTCEEGTHYVRVVEDPCSAATAQLRGVYLWSNNFDPADSSGYRLNQNINDRRPCNGTLPNGGVPFEISCPFVGTSSAAAILVYVLSGLGIAFSIGLGGFMFAFRTHRAIRSGSLVFCLLIIFGSVLVQSAPIVYAGAPTDAKIHAGTWLMCLGICVIFSALLAKTYRVHQIFISARLVRSLRITDSKLMLPFLCLVMGEVLLLSLFTFFPNADTLKIETLTEYIFPGTQATFTFHTAALSLHSFGVVLLLYNGLLIFAACILAYSVRRVPSQFRESSLLFICVYLLALMVFVIGVLTVSYTSENGSAAARHNAAQTLFIALGVCLFVSMTVTNTLLFVPKILTVFNIQLFSAHSSLSSRGKDKKADSVNGIVPRQGGSRQGGGGSGGGALTENNRSSESQTGAPSTNRELVLLREVEDLTTQVARLRETLIRVSNPHKENAVSLSGSVHSGDQPYPRNGNPLKKASVTGLTISDLQKISSGPVASKKSGPSLPTQSLDVDTIHNSPSGEFDSAMVVVNVLEINSPRGREKRKGKTATYTGHTMSGGC